MYPMPEHLKAILKADEQNCLENYVEGEIKCTCGSNKFSIKTFSSVYNDNGEKISVSEYKDGYELVIENICKECGKKYLIFDFAKHAYDGLICEDGRELENDSQIKEYRCPKCGKSHFKMKVMIETEDREQFIEEVLSEYSDRFTEQNYADIFCWITINITCCECGYESIGWVDEELS